MTFLGILETVFIGPLKLLFEMIFQISNEFIRHPGVSIIFLSLAMNTLVLPLYKRADAMQEEARDTENRLSRGVNHIKRVFSGDERMMITQAYYRQNNYKPTDALHGSVSLLLEIPFFMAAYQFLSNLEILNRVSLGPIRDLAKPDGLIVIGSLTLNLLPILMTLINVISSAIYLKGFPMKTKIQLYAMAAFFLVFLYTSPSGLVFYWTLNNLFSLVKTIFYKIKNPAKVLRILLAVCGAVLAVYGALFFPGSMMKKCVVVILGLALVFPLVWHFVKKHLPKREKRDVAPNPNRRAFLLGCLFLTLLVGILIPSSVIVSSPQEFVDISDFYHPLWYLVSSTAMAVGTFQVWVGVFYWLASPKGKVIFTRVIWVFCGVALVNYMFFGTNLGTLSSALKYEGGMSFRAMEFVLNFGVLAVIAAALVFVCLKFPKVITGVLATAVVAVAGMGVVNVVGITSSVAQVEPTDTDEIPQLDFSTDGKNVVVILLDRAMGEYVPYMMQEKPELKEQFRGFTYYSNVISHGGYTNMGVPAVLGGYDYTPVEMNRRNELLLEEKHNEALKMMPTLFAENGYDVTLCDPVYAGYQWIPDTSIFEDIPNTETYITTGLFDDVVTKERLRENNHRNFFCYGVMKVMPLLFQRTIYCDGTYHQAASYGGKQTIVSPTRAEGLDPDFMREYNSISHLTEMTRVNESEKNNYLFYYNGATHEPAYLQTPDYEPKYLVDNAEYDAANPDRFTYEGTSLVMVQGDQIAHYHANMATLMQLGKWFDHLRESGAWDNTKVVVVSDHGRSLYHDPAMNIRPDLVHYGDIEFFYPLLLVKDFGDNEEFRTSTEFMTNADVPSLVFGNGVLENPVNPFTGNPINMDEKTAHPQFVMLCGKDDGKYRVDVNNGTKFLPSMWASVEKDMKDPDNWEFYLKETVLTEHALPN